MIKQLLPGISILLLFSCRSNTDTAPVPMPPEVTVTMDTSFFPVTSFIKGQMRDFDSLAVTPLHIVCIKDNCDSQWIKREELKPLLTTFLEPEITATNLKKYFKETQLNDLTLGVVTFSYDPTTVLPDSIPLRNWNVYIDPKTQTVKRIYMVKSTKVANGYITQQLTWVTNTSAEIVNIADKPDGSSDIINREEFIWNF